MKNDSVNLICQKILESERIVVTSHLRPDGDSICTGLALAFIGELLGKEVEIINKDKTPFPLNSIPDIEKIKIGQIPAQGFDLVILLECANVSRSGQENLNDYFKINIDHHHSNDYYADINWVDPEASAVAEMIYTLGEKLKIQFTPQIANHLYCAIVSDTGSFQFSNTSSRSLQVCHELIDHGADVNTRSSEGDTPLHAAVRNGSAEVVELLLRHGADVNAPDDKGQTPLEVAERHCMSSSPILAILSRGKPEQE